LRADRQLAAYATWCTAVEGNTTFYALPNTATVASWVAQAPPGFRFVWKLPRRVTHDRRLRHAQAEVDEFFATVEPLGHVTGAVVAQLPPSFGPSDVDVLARFLGGLPSGWRYAVEVRHERFFDGGGEHRRLDSTLARLGVERVILDSRPLYSDPPSSDAEREIWGRKPRLPVCPDAITDSPIVRYIGRDDPARTEEMWSSWVDQCVTWIAEGRTPTVFVHTPDNVDALPLARRFHDAVAAAVPGLEPPPVPLTGSSGTQPSLF
jgi:uncharacterized protein YecE (DUF72 family)